MDRNGSDPSDGYSGSYAPQGETVASPALQQVSLPEVIGDWKVERHLGSGAMGEVFLAQRKQQRAALKLVAKRLVGDESFIGRFHREIELLAKLDHPNIARALDWGDFDGRPWLAMELIEGPNLETLLQGHGPFFEADALRLAIQLARGLEHIHLRAGLIHRDVKPANILIARCSDGGEATRLLNSGDQAKLIDFGLAKTTENQDQSLTMTGMIMGTPNYIAPEQVSCERNLTLHVDMYALGATVFHLLTGRVPFQAPSAAAVMAAHLHQPPPDPGALVPAISQPTRQVILTALAKRPQDRFNDWNAFVIACEKALAALSNRETPDKMLRKPLVKPPTTAIRPNDSGRRGVSTPGTTPVQRSPGTKPIQINPGTTPTKRTSSAPHSILDGDSDALEARIDTGAGSAALRAAVSSKITKGTGATHAPKSGQTSAVHQWSGRITRAGPTGGAILPLIFLGLTAILAVAGAVWFFANQ